MVVLNAKKSVQQDLGSNRSRRVSGCIIHEIERKIMKERNFISMKLSISETTVIKVFFIR